MLIRQEKAEDYEAVYHVVQEAFRNAEYTDGNEQNLVVALRYTASAGLQLHPGDPGSTAPGIHQLAYLLSAGYFR